MALVVVVPGPAWPAPRDDARRVVGSLASAVRAVRGQVPSADRMDVVEFGELFQRARRDRPDALGSVSLRTELLNSWWGAAARAGLCARPFDGGQGVDGRPAELAGVVDALGTVDFFDAEQGSAEHRANTLARYLGDPKLRHEVRDLVQGAISAETRVVVGHGVGALAAYEALCVLGDAASVSLVTLGAALCGPKAVFDRLEPLPRDNQALWPASVHHWSNIVSRTDPTAMSAPALTERFGPGIEDLIIETKSGGDDLYRYLLDRSTGLAVALGLTAERP
jgi:hypothetical protein